MPNIRGVAAAALGVVALAGVACEGRSLDGSQPQPCGQPLGCSPPPTPFSGDAGHAPAPDALTADAYVDGWIPPESCLLPFDVGPCDATVRVFAYVDGACVPKGYGGCAGNANRFFTIEECMATCEGRPSARRCPAGRLTQEICVSGGLAGGCAKYMTVCAEPCNPGQSSCPQSVSVCHAGVCQNISPE